MLLTVVLAAAIDQGMEEGNCSRSQEAVELVSAVERSHSSVLVGSCAMDLRLLLQVPSRSPLE